MTEPDSSGILSDPPTQPRQHFTRGVWFMVISLSCFSANVLILKYTGSHRQVSPWLALYVRSVIGFFVIIALFRGRGLIRLRPMFTERLLIWRGLTGLVGTACFYWTIPILGAGKSTLISSTYILFAALMAVLFLKERLGWVKAVWIVVALVGVMMLTGEGVGSGGFHFAREDLAVLAAIVGAVSAAAAVVVIRQLTRTYHSGAIYLCQCIYLILVMTPFVIFSFQWPGGLEFLLISAAAVISSLGQIAMTEGYRYLPVATGASIQMALPVTASIGGVLLFAETFTTLQVIGALLIVAGCFRVVAGKGN